VHLEREISCFENGTHSQEEEEEAQVMKLVNDCSSFFLRPQTVVIYQIQFLVLSSYHQNQDDLDRLHHVEA